MISTNARYQLSIEFEFTNEERNALRDALATVNVNPYRFYDAFVHQVTGIVASCAVPERFAAYVAGLAERDPVQQPVIWIGNAPVDEGVPPFDFDEPVKSKYELKKTFIAEGFLAIFGVMRKTPAIGYINVNDGDVFQDIYPKRGLQNSQSQKALQAIYFHKDLANHFVRPDHVYMLGMRSDPVNEVYTAFVRNIDVLEAFNEVEQKQLRSYDFYTPFDDLTVNGGNRELGDADRHPLLSGENDIRFFENRTAGLTPEAERIVDKLKQVLHQVKHRVFVRPGDFVCVYNNYAVHAKEVVRVGDEETLRTRWIIKTVNVNDLAPHAEHMIAGTTHLVNG